jgi:hypothetical protein
MPANPGQIRNSRLVGATDLGREPAGRTAWQSPLCPDSDKIPGLTEMKRCATCGLLRRTYSITSSASICIETGTSIPSALAVFKLMTSSNFVGCSTGRSAGFLPIRIWPVRDPPCRYRSSAAGLPLIADIGGRHVGRRSVARCKPKPSRRETCDPPFYGPVALEFLAGISTTSES